MDLATSRVVVTGGSGFLGTHVVEELTARGAQGVVAPRSRDADLTDSVATHRLFSEHAPDLVLHLAARVGGIGANQRFPGCATRRVAWSTRPSATTSRSPLTSAQASKSRCSSWPV